ncbi:TetR/AcrR family transcriptional regulator [Psychromicrobium sp. YIM B11713]|uniref:TetR/AcrR family transcriptional regulator n=1 Tax=Psychromicrobium sp. YIM B11713 TaxID=3145233 RepID=UPI00374F22D7
MGLRERKAVRTRQTILEVGFEFFTQKGYDRTTMEEIAEKADISLSTLYRYFPTKDLIVLDPIIGGLGMVPRILGDRPAEESIEVALGYALKEYLQFYDENADQINQLRAILDTTTRPRAQLWDLQNQEIQLLEEAIARRCGDKVNSLWVSAAAHATSMIYAIAIEHSRDGKRKATDIAHELDVILRSTPVVIPRL